MMVILSAMKFLEPGPSKEYLDLILARLERSEIEDCLTKVELTLEQDEHLALIKEMVLKDIKELGSLERT